MNNDSLSYTVVSMTTQEKEEDDMELTTLEIAQRCQKTERTVQRWIQHNKIKALHIQGNLYEVDEDDLQRFLPHEVVDSLSARISALEDRVHTLEHLVAQLSTPMRTTASQSSTLPGDLVAASIFGTQHGIAPTTIHKAIDSGRLAAIPGQWILGKATVKHALDAAGRAQFVTLYRDNPHFQHCETLACPCHE
jgi:excisionase family DNA binding protein